MSRKGITQCMSQLDFLIWKLFKFPNEIDENIQIISGEFDMRVKSCEASDGVHRPIQLSDERGCVLRPKMVSKFLKLRSNDGRSTVMSYAFFHAFKFPDSLQVSVHLPVEFMELESHVEC